jgi:hypothetical protein
MDRKRIIAIFNIKGMKILSFVVHPGQQSINGDLSKLQNGLQLVSFIGNFGVSTAKFVKE